MGVARRSSFVVRTYIYIACRGHSGSTLLEKLLATSPQVMALGEISHFSTYFDESEKACSCGRRVRECQFWNSVVRQLGVEGGASIDALMPTDGVRSAHKWRNLPYHLALLAPDVALRVAERGRVPIALRNLRSANNHWRVVQAVSNLVRTSVLVDKSMSPSRLLEVTRVAPADVRVCAIHLIRDGRANVHSYMTQFGLNLSRAAAEWRTTNVNVRRALRRVSDVPQLQVRYEDLCARPEQTLASIAQHFGIEASFQPALLRSEMHAIGGNDAKLTGYGAVRLDERWKTSLSAAQLALFERIAGPLNRRYGYD